MSSHNEVTPPPPPLSEAPPSYYSRDSLASPDSSHHSQHTNPHYTHDLPSFHNPQFEHPDNESLDRNSDVGYSDDLNESRQDDLPPPYSPGLGAILSTRLHSSQHDVNDAPPSYYSLFGQIREAREQSSNNFTFLRRVGQIILNTVGCTILLIVFMSVPITILVIGSIFVYECPLERFIPIYLIIGGISGILKNIFLIVENIIKRYSTSLSARIKHSKYIVYTWRTFNLIFNLFMLAWTIAGGYWVYHIYREVTDTEYMECRELLYKFGFGIVTSSYILLLLTCVCVCFCMGICLRVNKRRNGREDSPSLSDRDSDLGSENADELQMAEGGEHHYPSDDDSMFSEGNYNNIRRDTLTSTVDRIDSRDVTSTTNEAFLRQFRYLDSTDPIDTSDYDRAPQRPGNGAILQYDSSPYPTRHRAIRQIESPRNNNRIEDPVQLSPHLSLEQSPHGQNNRPFSMAVQSAESNSNDPDPITSRVSPTVERAKHTARGNSRTQSLYITISAEGYSVTEV